MPYLSQNCSHAVLNDGTLTCTLRVLVHAHQNLSSLHASYMLFAQSTCEREALPVWLFCSQCASSSQS